jgi:chorismate mutase
MINVPGLGTLEAPVLATSDNGTEYVIDVTEALTPQYSSKEEVRELMEFSSIPVLPVDELLIRRNLPRATSNLLEKFGL